MNKIQDAIEEALSQTASLRRTLRLIDEKLIDAQHALENDHEPTARALLDEAANKVAEMREDLDD